jgi:predicted acyl esterase
MVMAGRQSALACAIATAMLAAPAAAPAQTASAQTAPAQTAPAAAAPAPFEVMVKMRDGVMLAANVYLPAGKGPWPVILTRTPYLKDSKMFASLFGGKRYTDAGFAFVVQDVRGKGHSQGFYQAFVDDIPDGYDSVEAIAAEPWSNGKVGMTGASAMGITSNLAAIAAPPHLKAAYVIVAPNETFNTSFMGGVPKEKDTVDWMKMQGVSQAAIDANQAGSVRSVFAERSGPGENLKYINIPMYNVGGWYDIFNTGTIQNFEYLQNHGANGARGNQKLSMGPFGHGELSGGLAYPGEDNLLRLRNGEEIRWFSYWLKGEHNGIMDEPPVSYFMMAAAEKGAYSPKNQRLASANWPPAYREVRYFLEPGRGLSTEAPVNLMVAKSTYSFDPSNPVPTVGGSNLTFARGPMDQRAIPERKDYLRFSTPVLDKDVTIAGPVKVELWGATDGPDTDFEAKLVDVYPDGYEALVLDAPIRARYRNGRMPDQVKMMTPGAPEELVIDLWNTAITFEKGHRIALHITSSNSPRFEVNPNTGEAPGQHTMKPRVAANTVYFDKDHPSALVLPVIYPAQ